MFSFLFSFSYDKGTVIIVVVGMFKNDLKSLLVLSEYGLR